MGNDRASKEITPRERAICVLKGKKADAVPTMEIVFELEEALTGKAYILGEQLEKLTGKERINALNANVDLYVDVAQKLGYSSITIHPAPTPWYIPTNYYPTLKDQLYVIREVYKKAGNSILVGAGIDGTLAIPEGSGMEELIYSLADKPKEVKAQAQKNVMWAVEQMKRLIGAGAEVMYCCSDYCFNQGPFLSPVMFEEFVFPYLHYQTEKLREEGAYVIKHTDGNIMPILEMLIQAEPHCIHSIDPVANMDMQEVRKITKNKVCLMGNVDSTQLQTGDKTAIIQSCDKALEGSLEGGTIYSTCNSVFKGIELSNYYIMLDMLNNYNAQINNN